MNEYLNRQLDQISKLISGLKGADVGLEKLIELDRSLEMLSNLIKTVRLEGQEDFTELNDQGVKQDAAFYFNRQFRVVRFVGSYENIFGSGKIDDLPEVSSFFNAAGFDHFREKTESLLETGEPQSFYAEIISKNGLLLPVHFLLEKISFSAGQEIVTAGMVFFSQTPTVLENYREILIENLPGMDVYLFDTQFRHVLSGGREKERLGLSNADFIGKTLFEVYGEKTRKRLFPFYRNALDGKLSEGEVRIKGRVYFISATPVRGIDKQVVGGALISQDVTKEKEVEKNLLRAKREAEEADKAKSLFLASMSHEIRTPLNAIIGFTDLLHKTDLTPKQKKFSRLISQSSEHLLSVVNEVLFLFKLGMGKVYIEKVPFNLHELIRNVRESLIFRANEKDLEFVYSIHSGVPEVVAGDPFRLKQIISNLVGNAIKFTDDGRVCVRVSKEKSIRKRVFLRFEVEDTGIGIPKKDLDFIFDEFAQSGIGNEKRRKGAGLGLTIVKKLVDLLGGRMGVESLPGEGSTFFAVIPFEKTDADVSEVQEKDYGGTFNLLEGKRILYADDDENNLLLGESILKDWNVDYELAVDGAEALELLRREPFDLVLLDIHMPKLSGVEVLKKVKMDETNPNKNVKMLAVTANIMRNDIQRYLRSGFDSYIVKPFREENLYSKICNLLDLEPPVLGKDTFPVSTSKTGITSERFDTSLLLKTSGGDIAFFNQMIDTFISGAKEASEGMVAAVQTKNRNEIGKRAHKAIPSFRYFGLTRLVSSLMKLEEMTLRQRKTEPVEELVASLVKEIEKMVRLAEEAKIPEDGN
ncbi:response regulator [Mariniphaga sediminis]|uniref:histidine kinase n=1 Tax=Mariniphaga sediminis TaxID=1628158 RepID=A0A399CY40_9BACT|nr:ATP-binding protein [Mariniphaga sediminis]RIH63392.1 response regulator [Mariniphaga sediminis]